MEWNEPLYEVGSGANGRVGVLVSHGFTGSPRSIHEWAERLVEAGYTVAVPLLSGHGRTPQELEKVVWTDWTADVERAYAWLQERTEEVFVAGLSMGGTLALWMAERHPGLSGAVTVNAAVRDPREALMRLMGRTGVPRSVKGVCNDAKLPGIDEGAYGRIPARAARQYAQILAVVRRDLGEVNCPILIFSSPEDHVVPPSNQQLIYDSVGSEDKALVKLENSYHVATMDNDKELIFAGTVEFLAAHASNPQAGRQAR